MLFSDISLLSLITIVTVIVIGVALVQLFFKECIYRGHPSLSYSSSEVLQVEDRGELENREEPSMDELIAQVTQKNVLLDEKIASATQQIVSMEEKLISAEAANAELVRELKCVKARCYVANSMLDFRGNFRDLYSFNQLLDSISQAEYPDGRTDYHKPDDDKDDDEVTLSNSTVDLSSVPNDFSRFRCYQLYRVSDHFILHDWQPDYLALKKIVVSKLFNSKTEMFQEFLQEATSRRNTLLCLFANQRVCESTFQSIFIMYWNGLLDLYLPQFSVRSINSVPLKAKMTMIADSNTQSSYYREELTGNSDVAFIRRGKSSCDIMPADIIALGELKRPNHNMDGSNNDDLMIDQLVVQLEAVRQMTKGKRNRSNKFVAKGLLTDLKYLNTVFLKYAGQVSNIYISPKINNYETLFVQMLFSLLDLSEQEFGEVIEQASKPKKAEMNGGPTNRRGDGPLTGKRRKRKNPKKHSGGSQQSDEVEVIDFKLAERIEDYEQQYRKLFEWEAALYGQVYLSTTNLEKHSSRFAAENH
jgi:hypothetical protein